MHGKWVYLRPDRALRDLTDRNASTRAWPLARQSHTVAPHSRGTGRTTTVVTIRSRPRRRPAALASTFPELS